MRTSNILQATIYTTIVASVIGMFWLVGSATAPQPHPISVETETAVFQGTVKQAGAFEAIVEFDGNAHRFWLKTMDEEVTIFFIPQIEAGSCFKTLRGTKTIVQVPKETKGCS
ncbi:hypothetical protein K2Q00_03670 [Patescibacteria group bacterium]|nr:hypothetical protein [Patescibacteria group bacterium]